MNKNHTIAILGYNNHEITLQNIDHLRSSGCNDKILFWDNGSNPSYESEIKKRHNIEYIRKEKNMYVNPVWNELLKTCDTKYITFLNNDCFILSPNYFDEIIDNMNKNNVALSSIKTLRIPKMPKEIKSSFTQSFFERQPLKLTTKARRQGWLMTIDTQQYRAQKEYLIPDYLNIWYGDDWLWSIAVKNKLIYGIYSNRFAIHLDYPVTMTSKISEIIKSDERELNIHGDWHREISSKIHIKSRLLSRYV